MVGSAEEIHKAVVSWRYSICDFFRRSLGEVPNMLQIQWHLKNLWNEKESGYDLAQVHAVELSKNKKPSSSSLYALSLIA